MKVHSYCFDPSVVCVARIVNVSLVNLSTKSESWNEWDYNIAVFMWRVCSRRAVFFMVFGFVRRTIGWTPTWSWIKRQLIGGFCGFTYRDAVRKKLLKTFRNKLPFFLSGILRTQGFLIKFLNKSCWNGFIDIHQSLSNKKDLRKNIWEKLKREGAWWLSYQVSGYAEKDEKKKY